MLAPILLALPGLATAQQDSGAQGRVVDARSGAPVRNARLVRVWSGDTSSVADDGSWRVDPPATGGRLRALAIGYAPEEIEVSPGDAGVRIRLAPVAYDLEQVTITGSRRLQRLADTPVATQVISRDEIARTGATDLASVLTEHVGIELQGTITASAGVMLQGMDAQRVLVLVDGQPVAGRISGQFDVSRIPTAMVERVEVVKGPQSTLYGSEAMGGVVNVIMRGADDRDLSVEAQLLGGSHGRVDGNLSASGTRGPLSWLVSGGRRFSELAPGRAEDRGARSERLDGLATLRWAPDESRSVELSVNAQDQAQRWRTGQLYFFGDDQHVSGRLSGTLHAGAHTFRPTLYASSFDHLSRRSSTAEPATAGDNDRQSVGELELLYGFTAGVHAIDAGVEVRRDETLSDRLQDRERLLTTWEPFAQYTWSAADGAVSVVPGLRMSSNEQWGTHWSPRFAVLWRASESLALRTSIGEGFRSPSFRELYLEFQNSGPGFSYLVRGNPELEPESSLNLSLSAEWTGSLGFARVTMFDNRFEDFIETRVVGDSSGIEVSTYANAGAGFTRGIEVEGGTVAGPFTFDAGVSFLSARATDEDRPLLGRPGRSGRLTIGWAAPVGTRISATGVYTGAAPVSLVEDGATVEREAFGRLDLRVAQLLPWGTELVAGIDNALDARPEAWPGFSGRQFYLGLNWRGGMQ